MRKDSVDKGDFCPDCVNGNNSEETVANLTSYDEDDCCSCCCCCCSSAESEEFSPNVDQPNEAPAVGRALVQKKDLLSNLSIVRTNREQASIQNILQFVEALTHSNNFLRRYYMEEDFCLQCVRDSLCECNLSGISDLNINDSCACCVCESNQPEVPQESEHSDNNCSECDPAKKPSSNPSHNRRNRRRRRRRQRNQQLSNSVTQRRNLRRHPEQPQRVRTEDSDSECSECRRNRSSETQINKILDRDLCNCEECIREAEQGHRNSNHSNTLHSDDESTEFCSQCPCNSRVLSNAHMCSDLNCEDCNKMPSNESDCNKNGCNSDCSECRVPQDVVPCECCRNSNNTLNEDSNKVLENTQKDKSNPNRETMGNASGCNPCYCEECQSTTECSDESCEECSNPKSENKNFKQK
ncbi:uncharacterized protein CDAR_263681 [Caerostris darwini]|uniref:Uncharacterized protein n=1 Tax=Caerostris darwini TaxID=1538125 RepID=A0AAV4RW88_9ARAC|nr:uncharacterized protein CDAR_263681 [Caerostris darwini]